MEKKSVFDRINERLCNYRDNQANSEELDKQLKREQINATKAQANSETELAGY